MGRGEGRRDEEAGLSDLSSMCQLKSTSGFLVLWGLSLNRLLVVRSRGEKTPAPTVLNIRSWLKCHPCRAAFPSLLGAACVPLGFCPILSASQPMSLRNIFLFIWGEGCLTNGYFVLYLGLGLSIISTPASTPDRG